jgi:hypothetical protein
MPRILRAGSAPAAGSRGSSSSREAAPAVGHFPSIDEPMPSPGPPALSLAPLLQPPVPRREQTEPGASSRRSSDASAASAAKQSKRKRSPSKSNSDADDEEGSGSDSGAAAAPSRRKHKRKSAPAPAEGKADDAAASTSAAAAASKAAAAARRRRRFPLTVVGDKSAKAMSGLKADPLPPPSLIVGAQRVDAAEFSKVTPAMKNALQRARYSNPDRQIASQLLPCVRDRTKEYKKTEQVKGRAKAAASAASSSYDVSWNYKKQKESPVKTIIRYFYWQEKNSRGEEVSYDSEAYGIPTETWNCERLAKLMERLRAAGITEQQLTQRAIRPSVIQLHMHAVINGLPLHAPPAAGAEEEEKEIDSPFVVGGAARQVRRTEDPHPLADEDEASQPPVQKRSRFEKFIFESDFDENEGVADEFAEEEEEEEASAAEEDSSDPAEHKYDSPPSSPVQKRPKSAAAVLLSLASVDDAADDENSDENSDEDTVSEPR